MCQHPVGGIVHTHSPYAVGWAQAGEDIPCYGTTHADYFYGPVPCARHLTQEELDAMVMEDTGMTLYEQFAQNMDKDTFNEIYSQLFARIGFVGVYYIDNGMFYSGADWDVMMDVYSYTLDGDNLTLKDYMYAGEETFDIVGKRLVTEE